MNNALVINTSPTLALTMALDKPIVPWLMATLDAGEASVIAQAPTDIRVALVIGNAA